MENVYFAIVWVIGLITGAWFMSVNWRAKMRQKTKQYNLETREYIEFILGASATTFKYPNLFGSVAHLLEQYRLVGGEDKKFQYELAWYVFHWLRRQSDYNNVIMVCDAEELSSETTGTVRHDAARMIITAFSDGPAKEELIKLFSKALPGKTETKIEDFAEFLRSPFFAEANLYGHFLKDIVTIKELEPIT